MKLHPDIARFLYFCIQAIRKEPVREELRKLDAEFYGSQQDIQDRVWQRGQETLLFALKHVAYYRENCSSKKLFEKVSTIKNYQDFIDVLMEFPIIDKQTFIKNKQLFQSDLSPSIKGYKTYSSGSTGEPVTFKRDQVDWARSHANLIKILEFFGIKFGVSHIYYWAGDWTLCSRLINMMRDFLFNRKRFTVYKNTVSDLDAQLNDIIKYKPCYIYGLPSGIARLSQYLVSSGKSLQNYGLQCIFTTGENLSSKSKEKIVKAFGVPVCDIYGCSETGLIAFECPHGKKHIFIDTNFTEITEDKNILITNFFQRKNVLIRYELGDLVEGKLLYEQCECGLHFPTFGGISGRNSVDIILPNQKKIPSMAVAYIFDRVIFDGSILEGRFVLNASGKMVLYLVPGANFTNKAADILKQEAEALFAMDTAVEIVDTIPPARSGKKIDFISEWKP